MALSRLHRLLKKSRPLSRAAQKRKLTLETLEERTVLSFLPPVTFPVGVLPRSVTVGDFNNDGKPDLVVVNQGVSSTSNSQSSLSVLLGNGSGSFQPAITTNVVNSGLATGNAESAAVGDFNGDHLLDVALNTAGPAGPAVEVLLGKGDGSFQPNHEILSVGQTPLSVAVGDFDRNGALDLVTANSQGTLSVLLGNGGGSFRPRIDLAVGGSPHSVAIGDFNSDGRLDVVATQQLTDTASVLLGHGDGTFAQPLVFAASGQNFTPQSLALGDVNGDGKLDLAIKSVSFLDSDAFQVGVLLGRGDGTFQAPLLGAAQPDGSGDLALGDFNNDGRLDAAVADQLGASSGNLSVFAGNGDGTFQSQIRLDLLTGGNDPEGVAAADLNGDGVVDLVAANASSSTVGVLLNDSRRGVTATLSAGVLTVTGDAQDNTIAVSRDASGSILVNNGAITVQGGAPTIFNTRIINVFGLGGNDNLSLVETNGALPRIANLDGGDGNDTLTGGSSNDVLTGGAGNDTFRFDTDNDLGRDIIDESGGGVDTLDFSATTTRAVSIDLSNAAEQVVNAGLTLTLSAGNTIENVTGGALGDTITGNDLNNVIEGGGGDDFLSGGAGSDTYRFDTDNALGNDTIFEFDAIADPRSGVDTLDFSATTTRSVSIDLGAIKGTQQVVNAGLTLSLGVDTIENVTGGALGDTITGNALNNSLDGGPGNDTIVGGAGNDTLTGGTGNDTFRFDTDNALGSDTINESGGGVDTLDFSATTTRAVSVNLGVATAQVVNAGLTLTLSAGNTIENVTGGALGDTITGNALNNVIEGLGGNDTLTGGAGNDTFRFDTDNALGSDTINESGGGIDTLDFSATTTRAVSIDLGNAVAQVVNAGLTLTLSAGNTIENVTGGALGDTITGNALNNSLDGGPGNDTIVGGAGNDTLTGGAGNDTFRFDTDNALGSDTINESGGGVDTLDFSATTTRAVSVNLGVAAAQVVNAGLTLTLSAGNTIENVTGGALGDTITGNALNNVIEGLGGNDTLTGGAGNDTFRFDTDNALGSDTINESGGGIDTLDFSATTTRAVSINLGNAVAQVVNAGLTLTLSAGNTIENVTGGALGDTITGNALNNSLDGGPGNDTIEGGGGNDTLTGGAGNDTFRFDTDNALGSDTINESGGGVDTLDFSATTTRAVSVNLGVAAAQVVNAGLTLTLSAGNTIENVTGGALSDSITGNALNNSLAGGGGNDTLDGGAGTDTLDGGAGTDVGINGEVLINIP